ncbi:MAG: hypothetical protein SAJ37_10845 [Oscillatoria sp. PMC 1068.18]|nr:hypothetical protein [Oscillatoria sp. PMC 1076.18]MEC4989237.1 hypothetical protein [Oscillatoria sp. PMC 1068.18]
MPQRDLLQLLVIKLAIAPVRFRTTYRKVGAAIASRPTLSLLVPF